MCSPQPHPAAMHSLANIIESISEWTGRIVAWLLPMLVLLIVYDVGMRYLWHSGSIALQELEWHLFALLFLLGAGYTLKHDGHVRVDMLHQAAWVTPVHKAWVDIIGGLLFLLPFCTLIIYASWPFVANAFHYQETSPDPGGLPYRFVLKAAIPVGFALLLLQGVASILRAVEVIRSAAGDKASNHQAGAR